MEHDSFIYIVKQGEKPTQPVSTKKKGRKVESIADIDTDVMASMPYLVYFSDGEYFTKEYYEDILEAKNRHDFLMESKDNYIFIGLSFISPSANGLIPEIKYKERIIYKWENLRSNVLEK